MEELRLAVWAANMIIADAGVLAEIARRRTSRAVSRSTKATQEGMARQVFGAPTDVYLVHAPAAARIHQAVVLLDGV